MNLCIFCPLRLEENLQKSSSTSIRRHAVKVKCSVGSCGKIALITAASAKCRHHHHCHSQSSSLPQQIIITAPADHLYCLSGQIHQMIRFFYEFWSNNQYESSVIKRWQYLLTHAHHCKCLFSDAIIPVFLDILCIWYSYEFELNVFLKYNPYRV